jgi:hypothetical protein
MSESKATNRNLGETPGAELSEEQRKERLGKRRGLSINDTIAGDASLSAGSRGVDTSGVESGSGAGSGLTMTTPGQAGESPAPNIVPGARGSGTTPRGASAPGQIPTERLDSDTAIPTHDEIAARAYKCWHERGCPEGSSEADWCQAEEELREERSRGRSAASAASAASAGNR